MGYLVVVLFVGIVVCVISGVQYFRRRSDANARRIEALVTQKFQEELGHSKSCQQTHNAYGNHLFGSSYGYESNEHGPFYPGSGGDQIG